MNIAVLLATFARWLTFCTFSYVGCHYYQQTKFCRHQSVSEWCRCRVFDQTFPYGRLAQILGFVFDSWT